ncbi:MAG: hypothetical protein ACI9G1_001740 [Pirellulaceae bacterium]|jgi:hypothetical protein
MNQRPTDEPNIPRLQGIRDAAGENIFSDGKDVEAEALPRNNLLSTPIASEGGPLLNVNDVVPTLKSRGKTVFVLSWGLLLVLAGVASWIVPALGFLSWYLWPILSISLFTLGISLCLPAAIMGYNDLNAMRAGAMPNDQRASTTWGFWLGTIGTVIGAIAGPVSFIWFNWIG